MQFLEHAQGWITDLFPAGSTVLFVPYALKDHEGYFEDVSTALAALNINVVSAHHAADPCRMLDAVDGVFIGGGNTFRLLDALHKTGLKDAIAAKVRGGMPFMGSSAGTNMACPTLKTTNDMPIVQPPSFQALGLIGFQINPHYLDPDPTSTHQGETRETRIKEFHEENATPVLGLREASALRLSGDRLELLGNQTARLFMPGAEPVELQPGVITPPSVAAKPAPAPQP